MIRVEGLKECEAALQDLINTAGVSTATGKNTVRRAMRFSLEPIKQAMINHAPVLKGRLKAGINISTQLSRRQRAQHVKQDAVEVFVGVKPLPQAHLTEFGAAHMAPRAWARPAVDQNVPTVIERFKSQLLIEIQKTAERHARKAARLLARSS
jgi:HK97 gp10 family phage protein